MKHIDFSMSSRAVWVKLDGGLGNQMFQYAFGRMLADSKGCDLVLDASGLGHALVGVTPRVYAMRPFNLRAKIYSEAPKISNFQLKLLRRIPLLAGWVGVYSEKGHDYDPGAVSENGFYWVGYWQSHKYLQASPRKLFEDFSPQLPLSDSACKFIKGLNPSTAVMLHVRRGDYVKLASAAQHHGVMSLDYYKKAVNQCLLEVPDASLYIFSDDIEWCRNASLVNHASRVTYVESDSRRGDWEDLWMMSHCGHHIIANSSFSWWAAWLADQRYGVRERKVWAPQRWFLTEDVNLEDRFPAHWRVL